MGLTLDECVVLHGPDLRPHRCKRLVVRGDTIAELNLGPPCTSLDAGALVVMPAMVNAHTHMGDAILPDGATGMTLEQGFFRPDGYKYRQLAARARADHLPHITAHLGYMARSGTATHIDFREQGVYGSELLREAARSTGVNSVVLGQFAELPFDAAQLARNSEGLAPTALGELERLLAVADGFSESTMNDLTDLAWRQIRSATEKLGKLRAIHCLENDAYRDTSMAVTGRGDLERALQLFAPHLVIHATVANPAEIAMLSAACSNVVLNPRANANLGLPIPPLAALMRCAANLLLGTDNGLLNSPNMFAEMDYTYKIAKSQFGNAVEPDPALILAMATSNARAALGGDTWGRIELGLPADLVVLDFFQPHLRATRHVVASVVTRVTPADVLATYRQGRALYRAADFQS
jgi:cytosine/adenosine deaminase-related metal-dependent hydrolase